MNIDREESNVLITGTQEADSIKSTGANVTINAGDGRDTVTNYGNSAIIDTGDSRDDITNYGERTSINAGTSGDSINNSGQYSTLLGDAGDDTINNTAQYVSAAGGNGADSIYNGYRYYEPWNAFYDSDDENYKGNNSTISGGAGDDSIKNCGDNVLFKYTAGDGADTILGFNATSTLSVSGDAYSTQTSNSDIIVTVGKGKIALQGGARLATVNIDGKEKDYWTINGSTATYGTTSNTLIAIDGVANGATAANFYVKGNTVTIGKAAVKTDGTPVKLLTDGYTLKLGKGMTAPVTSTKATLKTGKYTFSDVTASGYNLADNSITYVAGSTTNKLELKGIATKPSAPKNDIVTLKLANFSDNLSVVSNSGGYKFSIAKGTYNNKIFTGSKGEDTIKSAAASLKINAGKGNDSITNTGANVSINAGAGNDYILSTGKNVTMLGGTGNDSLWGSSYADNFIYSSGDGKDIIFGFDDNDTLTLDSLDFKASYSKSKDAVTLKFDTNNTITFKDFTATTFHINNDVYKISGSKLKKQ